MLRNFGSRFPNLRATVNEAIGSTLERADRATLRVCACKTWQTFTLRFSFPGSAGERTVFETLPRPGLAEPAMQWVPRREPGNQN